MALITYLTRIQFDFGALKLLEAELQLLGMRRPLIVTDKGVIAAGLWARVKEQLPGNMPIALYDGTPENPTEAAMRDALKIYKEEGCDGIIAIGGGSPMDLAKAVGSTRASRAVGLANGKNPLSIIVPCHRVIGSDGSLTGFAGGLKAKAALLALESKAAHG